MACFPDDGYEPEKELNSCLSVCGKESISFLQTEQIFITQLNELHKLISLPVLKEKISNSDSLIQNLKEIIVYHQSIHSGIISGKNSLTSIGTDLPSHLEKWSSYWRMVGMELNELQKSSSLHEDNESIYSRLCEPFSLISKFEGIFQNLCDAMPENENYRATLEAIQEIFDAIMFKTSLPQNALKLLRIQRLLINRQPKIFSPTRILLKEGCLYKVNYRKKKTKNMALILFDDFLLICKIRNKSFGWHIEDSLRCYALLPLHVCSVNFASGGSSVKGNLFKVNCWNISYLLMSKVPGDVQSWIQTLQSAIRRCKASCTDVIPNRNYYKKKKSNWLSSNCSWFF
ncbi:PH domain-containing protein [Caerostris darwini]|uniref:PH domain-containing protein n=1 Tax=Caerostris darwini TaxID=1538125 RepID=A0AAV4PLQ5_9ARAC|nr:PH domain-containing protein [Caerostris darwini]